MIRSPSSRIPTKGISTFTTSSSSSSRTSSSCSARTGARRPCAVAPVAQDHEQARGAARILLGSSPGSRPSLHHDAAATRHFPLRHRGHRAVRRERPVPLRRRRRSDAQLFQVATLPGGPTSTASTTSAATGTRAVHQAARPPVSTPPWARTIARCATRPLRHRLRHGILLHLHRLDRLRRARSSSR